MGLPGLAEPHKLPTPVPLCPSFSHQKQVRDASTPLAMNNREVGAFLCFALGSDFDANRQILLCWADDSELNLSAKDCCGEAPQSPMPDACSPYTIPSRNIACFPASKSCTSL